MITFRARHESSDNWTETSFSGEDEDLLAHLFARHLAEAGWELLVSEAGGEFEELDDGWLV